MEGDIYCFDEEIYYWYMPPWQYFRLRSILFISCYVWKFLSTFLMISFKKNCGIFRRQKNHQPFSLLLRYPNLKKRKRRKITPQSCQLQIKVKALFQRKNICLHCFVIQLRSLPCKLSIFHPVFYSNPTFSMSSSSISITYSPVLLLHIQKQSDC